MKFGISDIVTAFDPVLVIGTKVIDAPAFERYLESVASKHDWTSGKTPGQALLRMPAEALATVSCGVGRRTTKPSDYVPALHRGRVGLYLRRGLAVPATSLSVVLYTMEAYAKDPDITPSELERLEGGPPYKGEFQEPCTHVIVAVLAGVDEDPQLSPWGFVHNLAGGNNDYLPDKLTVEGLIEQAKKIEQYAGGWCTVADGEPDQTALAQRALRVSTAMGLLREANAENKYGDNVLLSTDWFDRARRLVEESNS